MSEPVFNSISAIIGMRGTGKTAFFRGDKDFNIPAQIIPLYPAKGMKVLITDTLDHPKYRDIPIIKREQLAHWKKGVYRIICPSSGMKELNRLFCTTLSNTLLVYEDAYKHTKEELDAAQEEILADSKQKNIDVLFMYHSWFQIPRQLYRDYLEYIEVFKTKDSPESRKDVLKIVGCYDEAMLVYEQVKNNPSRFYHKTLSTEQ